MTRRIDAVRVVLKTALLLACDTVEKPTLLLDAVVGIKFVNLFDSFATYLSFLGFDNTRYPDIFFHPTADRTRSARY